MSRATHDMPKMMHEGKEICHLSAARLPFCAALSVEVPRNPSFIFSTCFGSLPSCAWSQTTVESHPRQLILEVAR